jgi:hypothetical protein
MFIRTNYLHLNDSFNDDPEANIINQPNQPFNGNKRSSVVGQWRSPPVNGDQIFFLPYSRLNMYESMLLNRNLITTYNQWLNEEVTDVLSHYIGNNIITNLYAITKSSFIEVKSFSHLFYMLKVSDTFIGCTEEEYEHSKRYLLPMKPDDFFANTIWPKKVANSLQRNVPKQGIYSKKILLTFFLVLINI